MQSCYFRDGTISIAGGAEARTRRDVFHNSDGGIVVGDFQTLRLGSGLDSKGKRCDDFAQTKHDI